jgi:hypothetical protein
MAGCGILLTCGPQSLRPSPQTSRSVLLILASILNHPIYAMKEIENFRLDG